MNLSRDVAGDNVITFRATLVWFTPVWRDIEIRENQSLIALHRAIQDAFMWYDDHLYAFFMGGHEWDSRNSTVYTSPESLKEAWGERMPNEKSAKVILGRLGLYVGQKIAYIYDYGDNLSAKLQVRKISMGDLSLKYPRVTALRGHSPEQYRYHEGYSKKTRNKLKGGLPKIVRINDGKKELRILKEWSDA